MTHYPKTVYRSPGATILLGKTYTYRIVSSDAELESALASGWSLSVDDAWLRAGDAALYNPPRAPWRKPKGWRKPRKPSKPMLSRVAKEIVVDDTPEYDADIDAPPTREELIDKATQLGIKFGKRAPDSLLIKLIEDKLAVGG